MNRNSLFGLIEAELMAVESELAHEIRSKTDLVTDIGNQLLLAGGKRLRPALYLLCARSGNDENLNGTIPVAVAIELIHMATLVHDDVLDDATVRRGVSTANAQWGNYISILSGDYLFAKAFSLISESSTTQTLQFLTNVICEICEGEISQFRNKFNPYQTEDDYLKRIAQKTAGFIAVSTQLGAMAAGLDHTEIEELHQYGYAIGMAFQIIDDVLDITASMEQIGKPVCNDLREGILTLPIIYALQRSPRHNELRKLILTQDMSDNHLEQSMFILNETNAVEYTYQRVREYLQLACKSIPNSLPDNVQKALLGVTHFIGGQIRTESASPFDSGIFSGDCGHYQHIQQRHGILGVKK